MGCKKFVGVNTELQTVDLLRPPRPHPPPSSHTQHTSHASVEEALPIDVCAKDGWIAGWTDSSRDVVAERQPVLTAVHTGRFNLVESRRDQGRAL